VTFTLPAQLDRLVRLRAAEDREKPRANRWRYYESFRAWAYFATETQSEQDAACDLYRELAGMEESRD
jgi:hypothetical protein